jgi:hypothetical protein
MTGEFDRWIEPMAPELKEANALYARASKGDIVEQAIELAGINAQQYSGSGFENALRAQFRQLARKIAKNDPSVRGINDATKKAIRLVADGGDVQNALRDLGKLAPTGVVSAGLGGGVPFMVGNTLAGPELGAAMSAGSMGSGMLGRMLATRMGTANAEMAAAIARNGGPLAMSDPTGDLQRALLAAAMARQSAPLREQAVGSQTP